MKIIFPLIRIAFIVTVSAQLAFATDPWWMQGYEMEQTTQTVYSYEDGEQVAREEIQPGGKLTFFDLKSQEVTDFTPMEQEIYQKLEQLKRENVQITYKSLIDQLTQIYGAENENKIINMLGFFEYTTETGFYTYLRNAPDPKEVALFDEWFELYVIEFPTPPATPEALKEIEKSVLERLAEKNKMPVEAINEVLYRMKKYQEKHRLPRDKKISDAFASNAQP